MWKAEISRAVVAGWPGKKFLRHHVHQYMAMLVYTCHPPTAGSISRKIMV
jgi:hypothetical protein